MEALPREKENSTSLSDSQKIETHENRKAAEEYRKVGFPIKKDLYIIYFLLQD